jgi:hypothetical protein
VLPLLGVAALSWWLGDLLFHSPEDDGDAGAIAAVAMSLINVSTLGAALIVGETLLLTRWHETSFADLPVAPPGPPGWFADPWDQAPSRWWNGFNWTGGVR